LGTSSRWMLRPFVVLEGLGPSFPSRPSPLTRSRLRSSVNASLRYTPTWQVADCSRFTRNVLVGRRQSRAPHRLGACYGHPRHRLRRAALRLAGLHPRSSGANRLAHCLFPCMYPVLCSSPAAGCATTLPANHSIASLHCLHSFYDHSCVFRLLANDRNQADVGRVVQRSGPVMASTFGTSPQSSSGSISR
jgi:hypothetical protein